MRGHRSWALIAALAVATLAFFSLAAWSGSATSAQVQQAPPRPPWVGPNGVVDLTRVPQCFTMVGADGKQVKDNDGKALCGKPFDIPVTESNDEVEKRTIPSGATVPGKRPPGVPTGPNDPPSR